MQARPIKIIAGLMVALIASILFMGSAALSGGAPGQVIYNEFGAALDSPSQATDNRYAVVIGIVYPDYELGVVKYADRDAEAIYNMLVTRLGYLPENVKFLQNTDASRANIIDALQWLKDNPGIDSSSEVVFFYSGHGLRRAPAEGTPAPLAFTSYALVPYDYGSFDYEKGQGLIWDRELAYYLEDLRPGSMWVAIDSCFSGGFIQPGISGPNRVLTMSSTADQLSSEIDHVGRGVMTQLLVEEGLLKGISVEEAFWKSERRYGPEFGQNPQIVDDYNGELALGDAG